MKILYDHQAFEMQSHGGVSRCFAELISHLPTGFQYKIAINENQNIYLKESDFICDVRSYEERLKDFFWGYKFKGKRRIFNCLNSLTDHSRYRETNKDYSIRQLEEGDFDVFHPTYFDDYFLDYLNGKPFVLTIHDMIPELFPQYFAHDDFQIIMKKKLAYKANKILTVSENTKKDIIRILGVDESKVSVIYHGSLKIKPVFSKQSPYPFPYLLYVGQRWEYKNFRPMLKAFAQVAEKDKEIKLVCTSVPFNEVEKLLISELGLTKHVINLFVNSDELFSLYHHAVAFIYPSLYEGFGIPILEAFSCGCLVMLNNASCFPEIGGDAAIYFEMNDNTSNFSDVYEQMLSQRKQFIQRGYERLNYFSWEKSAAQLGEIYKSIV